MDNMKCPSCGGPMKRNGRAPSGAQRWCCRSCGASATHSNDVAARELAAFVGCVFSTVSVDKIGVMISTK